MFTLHDLEAIIAQRATASSGQSYTAKLATRGINKAAEKLGEEAIETVVAAVTGDKAALTAETADLLYHLMVVLHLGGVGVGDVMYELERRTSQSGLAEKASRPKV